MILRHILSQFTSTVQLQSLVGFRSFASPLVLSHSNVLSSDNSKSRSVLSVSCGFEPQITQVRHRNIRRRIMGHPRPPIPGKITPEANKYRYIPVLPKVRVHTFSYRPLLKPFHFQDERYTVKPLPIIKLGGRDPVTKRVVVRTIGGGNKNNFRWVDYTRHAPEGESIEEKVYNVRYDPLNTFLLALVANGGHKRWIIASEHMKPGDVIKTTNIISRNPVRVKEGDAWPLGAIPPGKNRTVKTLPMLISNFFIKVQLSIMSNQL